MLGGCWEGTGNAAGVRSPRHFLWLVSLSICLSFPASILVFFLNPNQPTCAESSRDPLPPPPGPAVRGYQGGKGAGVGEDTPGSFVLLLELLCDYSFSVSATVLSTLSTLFNLFHTPL